MVPRDGGGTPYASPTVADTQDAEMGDGERVCFAPAGAGEDQLIEAAGVELSVATISRTEMSSTINAAEPGSFHR
ncbi:MAG: hypothetical protein QOF33_4708 [Thermomicrobiales bacterium]|nr:hypothetical protein [Thermomicrobiales bacterium]